MIVGGADSEMPIESGDEDAAAEQPDLDDEYVFFPKKDYVPMGDGIDKLPIQVWVNPLGRPRLALGASVAHSKVIEFET